MPLPTNDAHLNQQTMKKKTSPNSGEGKFMYLTPEITAINIAVEKGFAQSGELKDVPYDDSWETANS